MTPMHKDTVYFFKNGDTAHNCLKVHNSAGDELSLSGDDSCGIFPHMSRTSLCIFPDGTHTMSVPEIQYVTPEELLQSLAAHLGFTVVAIPNGR